jgi:hypothetical protein
MQNIARSTTGFKCFLPAYGGLQIRLGLSNFAWPRIRSALRLPGAGLSPAFLYRRRSVYLQGSRFPFESPHGTTASFGRTRSGRRTLYHLSAGRSFHPRYIPAGRPSCSSALLPFQVSRPFTSLPRFRSFNRWVSSNGGSKLLPWPRSVKGVGVSFTLTNSSRTSPEIRKLLNKKRSLIFPARSFCDEANLFGQN